MFCCDDITCDTSNDKYIYRFGIDNDTTKDKSNLRIKSQKEAHKLFKAVYQNYSIRLDGTYRVVVVSKEQS